MSNHFSDNCAFFEKLSKEQRAQLDELAKTSLHAAVSTCETLLKNSKDNLDMTTFEGARVFSGMLLLMFSSVPKQDWHELELDFRASLPKTFTRVQDVLLKTQDQAH